MCFSDLSGEGKADFEEPKVQEKGISVNMVGNSSLLNFEMLMSGSILSF